MQEYAPAIGGMAEVARQLSERLVAMGHKVTVATGTHPDRKENTLNAVNIFSFAITGNAVNGYTGNTAAYEQFLLAGNYDVVTCFAAQQWATDLTLPLLDKIKGKKVFVPTGFSYLHNPAYKDYYEGMKGWMQHFDANVFLSDSYQDIEFARKNNVTRNHLITNAASEEEFDGAAQTDIRKKFGIDKNKFLVLHVGSFTGAKGQPEAIKIFLKANIPDSVLLLSGHNNAQLKKLLSSHPRFAALKLQSLLKGKRIIVTELNRKETVDAYKAADLFIFPSNIECSPIVLFECMAAGIPFLSSEVGNAAQIAKWGGNGIILPTEKDSIGWSKILIDESAQVLKQAAADRKKLKSMGEAGHAAWKKQFTWQKVAEQYEKLYLNLA